MPGYIGASYCGSSNTTEETVMVKYRAIRDPDRCPAHPGELLREVVIPATGRTRPRSLRCSGSPVSHLYDITEERKPVSPAVAIRLGKLFGDSAGVWVRMPAAYDTWHAARQVNTSKIPTTTATRSSPARTSSV